MEKEVATAGEMANPELSGGVNGYKEAVYNVLENFFGWLSTHQGLALIIILIVLGIMVWLILRAKKYRRQLKDEVYTKNKEIGKKDTLIEEQEKKLTALQKKMSDQQGVVSEALMRTIRSLTGYDADQLKIFFKFLTQISGNPLQIADTQANTIPESQGSEEESGDSPEESPEPESQGSEEESGDSPEESPEENDTKERIASGDDSSEKYDAKEKLASDDGPKEAVETKK